MKECWVAGTHANHAISCAKKICTKFLSMISGEIVEQKFPTRLTKSFCSWIATHYIQKQFGARLGKVAHQNGQGFGIGSLCGTMCNISSTVPDIKQTMVVIYILPGLFCFIWLQGNAVATLMGGHPKTVENQNRTCIYIHNCFLKIREQHCQCILFRER